MIYGSGMRMIRHYVEVVALHHKDNSITPLRIIWDDGRVFDVKLIGRIKREYCQTHGFALRHDVMLGRNRRVLWRDDSGWFVEVCE